MDAGLKISAIAHGGLILLALFGGQIFRSSDRPAEPVTTVTLLSQGEYAALVQPEDISPPPEVENPPEPEPEVTEPELEAEVIPPEPQVVEPLQPEGPPLEGVVANEDQVGELTAEVPDPDVVPEAADIITNEVTVNEDPVAEEAPIIQDASEITEGEAAPEPVQDATQEEATTTQVVTEADENQVTGAPVQTAIPRRRPESISNPAPEPEPQETAEIEEAPVEQDDTPSLDDLIATEVEAALQEELGNSDQGDPSPVPLTQVEASGLILDIQRCWSVPVGVEGAANLRVVVDFDLTPQGFVDGLPQLVEPLNLVGAGLQQAYEAARRAVLECQPYTLPVEKYETWRKLEIEFDPQNMVNR